MNAKFTKTECMNAVNYGGKKETIRQMVLITHKDGEFKEPVVVRWYMSRSAGFATASPMYCSLWVHSSPYHVSGRGKAGGGGYHKASAAFQYACDSAGIELSQPVDGCGDSLVKYAILAIGEALGYVKTEMHICEG